MVKTHHYQQLNRHMIAEKLASMTSQLRGMARVLRDNRDRIRTECDAVQRAELLLSVNALKAELERVME